jgi:Raf kinase inhibitor-like YbhB/YbcL family protein
MAFTISSSAFSDGSTLPVRFTCDGANEPPPLTWADPPPQTAAFALVMDDPDAPGGTFTHWLLWNIPASATSLEPGRSAGGRAVAGVNDFSKRGYGGPCPPRGHGPHRYMFRLHALDAPLDLGADATRADVDEALDGRVLATAELQARYARGSQPPR